ncbi:MAG: hypothetical protein WDO74_21680 [Pseudomonadota bacterium]
MANVSLTVIDPTSREQRLATPGDFTGVMDGKPDAVDLESYGMVYLSLTDATGEELTFKTGSKAEITIPVPTINGAPLDETPLWSYDEVRGRWVSKGTATYNTTTRTYSSTIDRRPIGTATNLTRLPAGPALS